MFRRKDAEPAPSTPEGAPTFAKPKPTATPAASQAQPNLPSRQMDRPAGPDGRPAQAEEAPASTVAPETEEHGKRLLVGEGISLAGEITACDRLVVQGSVQVTLNETRAIEIAESGKFTGGKAEVEEAEISGVYEGELTVRNRLLIKSTGRVEGTVRFGELEIERGGRLQGNISQLDN